MRVRWRKGIATMLIAIVAYRSVSGAIQHMTRDLKRTITSTANAPPRTNRTYCTRRQYPPRADNPRRNNALLREWPYNASRRSIRQSSTLQSKTNRNLGIYSSTFTGTWHTDSPEGEHQVTEAATTSSK